MQFKTLYLKFYEECILFLAVNINMFSSCKFLETISKSKGFVK